ncbi:MAG: bL21 family ribosomal protein, partial [Muribaculaceae bacterium]|nr:bL21 family ribosomal protein [Muribaculaceae bacterium]
MYAIVEIQGQQFKAEAGKKLFVHYLGDEKNEGDAVEFSKVLLVDA